MSLYTMIYKNGERMRDFFGSFCFYCSLVFYILGAFFNKTIIPLALVGYEMIIANSLAIYHLVPNARSWNKYRLLHRKCAVRIFIHESQNFRNERVNVANE